MSAINLIKAVGTLIHFKLLCKSHGVHKTIFYYFFNILHILLAIGCNHQNNSIIFPKHHNKSMEHMTNCEVETTEALFPTTPPDCVP